MLNNYTSYSVDGGFDSGIDSSSSGGNAFNDNDKNTGVNGEIAMWQAIITQALMDAGSNSKKTEMRRAKAEAISWLSGLSDDFEQVCLYADLSPDYVRKKSKEAIARGCTWRALNPNSFTKNRKQKKSNKPLSKRDFSSQQTA